MNLVEKPKFTFEFTAEEILRLYKILCQVNVGKSENGCKFIYDFIESVDNNIGENDGYPFLKVTFHDDENGQKIPDYVEIRVN